MRSPHKCAGASAIAGVDRRRRMGKQQTGRPGMPRAGGQYQSGETKNIRRGDIDARYGKQLSQGVLGAASSRAVRPRLSRALSSLCGQGKSAVSALV